MKALSAGSSPRFTPASMAAITNCLAIPQLPESFALSLMGWLSRKAPPEQSRSCYDFLPDYSPVIHQGYDRKATRRAAGSEYESQGAGLAAVKQQAIAANTLRDRRTPPHARMERGSPSPRWPCPE